MQISNTGKRRSNIRTPPWFGTEQQYTGIIFSVGLNALLPAVMQDWGLDCESWVQSNSAVLLHTRRFHNLCPCKQA